MSIDGRLLSAAIAKYERRKSGAAAELARRAEQAFAANPRIRELDASIRGLAAEYIELALRRGEDAGGAVRLISERSAALRGELSVELKSAGFPGEWLDDARLCEKCGDRGFVGREICQCLMEFYREEQRASLSSLFKLGDENFGTFDLNWYSDAPDGRTGVSPRRSMEIVFETCVQYARKFGENSLNLFFSGETGLGKTFLSACIARVVSEAGFSVVYDTAISVFAAFEEQRFSKPEYGGGTSSDPGAEIGRYLGCDLLILDDLGSEMVTSFTVSALYALINTRLTAGKKTIISSNLPIEEVRRRYSPAIASRLGGEYHLLNFYGDDIRLQKKGIV